MRDGSECERCGSSEVRLTDDPRLEVQRAVCASCGAVQDDERYLVRVGRAASGVTLAVDFSHEPRGRPCPYESCRQCGACGVCRDYHGDVYGGCAEGLCPFRRWHRVRDWLRRLRGPFVAPWRGGGEA